MRRSRPPIRLLAAAVCILVALVSLAGPAWAHEEIDPRSFPTGQPTYLTFDAANEKTVPLVEITLHAPADLAFGATTREPPGWTVDRTDSVITWTGGSVAPEHFEQWGFEIEGADQPGVYAYHALLSYADRTTDAVEVDVTVTPPATATSAAAAPAATGAPATTVPGGTARSSGPSRLAVAALILAAVATVTAVAALVVARGTRWGSAPPTVPTASAQDW